MPEPKDKSTPRLEVYLERSILFDESGRPSEFIEGQPSPEAARRLDRIKRAFETDFLGVVIAQSLSVSATAPALPDAIHRTLGNLVASVSSEVGRAIVGLTVLQLAIKAIEPMQSIRLHKGGAKGEGFSWADGIPMRVLDKNFNTPALRKHGLLNMNKDGVFMTRSLAENYPYSKVYKAALRGAKAEWLDVTSRTA